MPPPITVVILTSDRAFRSRVCAAMSSMAIAEFERWEELRDAIGGWAGVPMVIADPLVQGSEDKIHPQCATMLNDHPEISVLAAVDTRSIRPTTLLRLGQLGVAEVLCTKESSSEHIRKVVTDEHALPVLRLISRLRERCTARRWRILAGAATVGATGGNVSQFARELVVAERTLARYCQAEGLPAPRRLLAWARILKAAQLLQDRNRAVERVAYACGYSNESGLRRACYDLVGKAPTKLRSPEALREAMEVFIAECIGPVTRISDSDSPREQSPR